METFLTSVVWTFDTFESSFGISHKFKYYTKESFGLGFKQHFSSKYFLKITFVREISPKVFLPSTNLLIQIFSENCFC